MKLSKRFLYYFAGLLCIAVGINLSKRAGLGISPVTSIPRAFEVVSRFTLGQMVIAVYSLLVLGQFLLLRKKFRLKLILGIPVALVFGWLVDLVGIDPNAFGHLLIWLPAPQNYLVRLLYLAVSIVILGIGVHWYLKPDLIPMPAEGFVQAFSIVSGKAFGDCKTIVDCALIAIALIVQLVTQGMNSFVGDNVVVREGTIIAAILVGQVVKFIERKKKPTAE